MSGDSPFWCMARAWRTVAMAALGALVAAAVPGPAAAADWPFKLRLTSTVTWDANLFRIPEGAPDPQLTRGISGRSDRFVATQIGLRFDTSFSQQTLTLDAGATATRYEKFGMLNRDALNYLGAWDWRLGPRISGKLSANRSESQVSFEDAQGAADAAGQVRKSLRSE